MTAQELKIGDTFTRQGIKLTVAKITQAEYKKGTKCVIVECYSNGGKVIDSYYTFKLTTKVK